MGDAKGAPSASTYLVEHYWPGVTAERFRDSLERVRLASKALARAGSPMPTT